MRKPSLRTTVAALALLAALSFPHDSESLVCNDLSARNLLAGALADAALNPPDQEDNEFFTNQGGVPNIYFLMDTGMSMGRLPPNGPLSLGSPVPGTAGCGTGAAEGSLDPVGASTILSILGARTYHSPCGKVRTAVESQPYQPDVDYWQEATVCPWYTQGSNAFVSPSPGGYDPDWPAFFAKDSVFHGFGAESLGTFGRDPNATPACAHNNGSGWGFGGVFPYTVATVQGNKCDETVATMDEFCAAQGASSAVCAQCLKTRGWYYDGTSITGTYDGVANVQYPSVWYSGNYLSFFPPKFLVARKLVKDVIGYQARVRMALAGLSPTGFKPAPQPGDKFGPVCSQILAEPSTANWDSSRSTVVKSADTITWGETSKVLSQALFDVGRYYHTPTLSWFGADWSAPTWPSAVLSDTSAQQTAVCWSCQTSSVILLTDGVTSATDGASLPPGPATLAKSNSGIYAGDPSSGILDASLDDCPRCGDFTGASAFLNNLSKVSFYLHNYDLRSEAAGACGGSSGTLDGKGMPGKQVLDVYTVGFAAGATADATRALASAAGVGGGTFIYAEAADQLRDGIAKTFQEITTRSTSFSVATVSTLQTTTGHSVIVPRFDPSRDAHWAGHLFRYELYSEFVNPCTPNGAGDYDCDGLCVSVFLQDKDQSFIGEDGAGAFMKTDNGLPPCSQTPRCVALGKSCGALTNQPASPWWDAYETLHLQFKDRKWKERHIWTVTDDQVPFGRIDASDTMFELSPSGTGPTDAVANKLVPYLGLGTNGRVCEGIATQIQTRGDPVTAQVIRTSKRECAKTIVRWLLGADVLNEMGRNEAQGWPPARPDTSLPAMVGDPTATPPIPPNLPDQDLLLDRKFKLGDIYHSSPVVMDAPLPADGVLCPNGLHNQCMESLWRTPVKHVDNVNQYDLYAKSSRYKNRRKVILVGSNDGLLHAFNGGSWHANQNDTLTGGVDESKPPFEGYYDRGEKDGGPKELWAFLPPDLIGKLPALLGTEHQFFVDGTAMVRDVWVDGASNELGGASLDGKKEATEFHTLAIVGERRGGNHYFALDVTDATKLDGGEVGEPNPKFLWIYPQPNDPESLTFGETYTDFLPVPPPVGPVRIAADANAQSFGLANADNAPLMFVPESPTALPYHELWVTMLPGGFDPSYLRGRGVHMVDVWSGKEVFDFSYPTSAASDDPRLGLTYPVAATPAMVMWGMEARRPSLAFENNGYFDTSTFGDTGGQLWVLRFNRPGTMDLSGRATNWVGGRIFGSYSAYYSPTDARGSLCTIRGSLPFFYVTANTALPGSHVFRVYAGTGDRFNLLDTNGGTCGPDNIRACAQRACTVTLPRASNVLAATGVGYDAREMAQPACASWTTDLFNLSRDVTTGPPACGATASTRIEVTCPSNYATGSTSFTKDVSMSCTPDADGHYGCAVSKADGGPLDVRPPMSTYWMQRNWYYSLRVFEDSGVRTIFDSPDDAIAYDAARVWFYDYVTAVNPLNAYGYARTSYAAASYGALVVSIDGANDNPTTLADADSPGWMISYHHGPQITTDGHLYNVNLLDERTSSVSGLFGKVLWNTIQPALGEATSTGSCAKSKCQGAFRRLSYHYGADAITGGSVFKDSSGNPLRSIAQNTLVPTQGDQPTVFVNQKGQIAVGLTSVNPEKGASNLGMSAAMDPVMGLGVVEVSRDLHECRHVVPAAGPAASLSSAERATVTAKCKQ